MSDDKHPAKKEPKDLSKISTDDLIKEFAAMDAKLDTALTKEASKKLKFPEAKKEDVSEAEDTRREKTEKDQIALQKKMEDTPAEYRKQLEAEYRKVEKTRDDPEEFKSAVEEKKDVLLTKLKKDLATFTGELNTQIIKDAHKELGLPVDEEDLKKREREGIDQFIKQLDETQEKIIKKTGDKEEGEAKFSFAVQTVFETQRKIKNDPDLYREKVEEMKKAIQESPPDKMYGPSEHHQNKITGVMNDLNMALAQSHADALPKTDILWKEPVSDTLSLASLPRSNVRGAA
jgi:hypothetical protein